jgi:hypothetical protein
MQASSGCHVITDLFQIILKGEWSPVFFSENGTPWDFFRKKPGVLGFFRVLAVNLMEIAGEVETNLGVVQRYSSRPLWKVRA